MKEYVHEQSNMETSFRTYRETPSDQGSREFLNNLSEEQIKKLVEDRIKELKDIGSISDLQSALRIAERNGMPIFDLSNDSKEIKVLLGEVRAKMELRQARPDESGETSEELLTLKKFIELLYKPGKKLPSKEETKEWNPKEYYLQLLTERDDLIKEQIRSSKKEEIEQLDKKIRQAAVEAIDVDKIAIVPEETTSIENRFKIKKGQAKKELEKIIHLVGQEGETPSIYFIHNIPDIDDKNIKKIWCHKTRNIFFDDNKRYEDGEITQEDSEKYEIEMKDGTKVDLTEKEYKIELTAIFEGVQKRYDDLCYELVNSKYFDKYVKDHSTGGIDIEKLSFEQQKKGLQKLIKEDNKLKEKGISEWDKERLLKKIELLPLAKEVVDLQKVECVPFRGYNDFLLSGEMDEEIKKETEKKKGKEREDYIKNIEMNKKYANSQKEIRQTQGNLHFFLMYNNPDIENKIDHVFEDFRYKDERGDRRFMFKMKDGTEMEIPSGIRLKLGYPYQLYKDSEIRFQEEIYWEASHFLEKYAKEQKEREFGQWNIQDFIGKKILFRNSFDGDRIQSININAPMFDGVPTKYHYKFLVKMAEDSLKGSDPEEKDIEITIPFDKAMEKYKHFYAGLSAQEKYRDEIEEIKEQG